MLTNAVRPCDRMKDFFTFEFASEGFPARKVYMKGAGPAVVLLHELPGMIPECVDLGRSIAAAGFTVYMPLLPESEPTALQSSLPIPGFSPAPLLSAPENRWQPAESAPGFAFPRYQRRRLAHRSIVLRTCCLPFFDEL